MYPRYHALVTQEALQTHLAPGAVKEVVAANLGQDSLPSLFGTSPHHHFDDDKIAESIAYVESEHQTIVALATDLRGGRGQRAAFGRLCHTVQDFYSHSNYVQLWLEAHGGLAVSPEDMDGLDEGLLNDPRLQTGHFIPLWSLMYYIPVLRHVARRIYLPANSHEAMNVDSPARGPQFAFVLVAARQRTQHEYAHAAQAILSAGGSEALRRFEHAEG
jgi:hypothetical protein